MKSGEITSTSQSSTSQFSILIKLFNIVRDMFSWISSQGRFSWVKVLIAESKKRCLFSILLISVMPDKVFDPAQSRIGLSSGEGIAEIEITSVEGHPLRFVDGDSVG